MTFGAFLLVRMNSRTLKALVVFETKNIVINMVLFKTKRSYELGIFTNNLNITML